MVEPPPHWDEVAAYALARGVAPDKLKQHRPPLDHARRAVLGGRGQRGEGALIARRGGRLAYSV